MRLLIINPGATSTKISVFEEDREVFKKNIDHPADELAPFEHIVDQFAYRLQMISDAVAQAGYTTADFSAVCARGGLLRHIPSGTYRATDRALDDARNPPYGEHASNLGVLLARAIADPAQLPAFFVDPVSVDEMTDVARISGLKGMQRESFFHALNHKAMARRAARQLGKQYEALNLIVVHMGGGVSVAAHEHGRVVDVNNVKDEGAFAMDRAGSLPVNAVIKLCFSGKSQAEVKKLVGTQAGVFSYLGTRDFREVEQRRQDGDAEAALIFDAFVYRLCKDVGAMASVLCMEVDAVVLTGGIANSKLLVAEFERRVGKLAPILVIPGEEEMRSLAEGALRVLRGEDAAKEY